MLNYLCFNLHCQNNQTQTPRHIQAAMIPYDLDGVFHHQANLSYSRIATILQTTVHNE